MIKWINSATLLLLLVVMVGGRAFGQSVLKEAGLRKLSVFLGTWKAESTVDAAHPAPVSATYTCQWSSNGRYLVADQLVNNNGVETNNLSIYNYNADKDTYTLSLVGIPNMAPWSIGVVARGDTLIYNSEYVDNGKKMYNRTLNIFSSATAYVYLIQFSEDGVKWRTDGEGKARKLN